MKCVDLIYKDLYRVGGGNLIRSYFTFPGFKYLCVFRLIQSFKEVWYLKPIVFFLKVKLIMMQRKYGILIPARCTIGEGFFIGHWGTIVVNEKVKIGRNVNISQGVTIGQLNRESVWELRLLVMRFILVQARKYWGILLLVTMLL